MPTSQPALPDWIDAASNSAAADAHKTVLVVDDDALNRYLLSEALTADGYRTIEAGDGLEALDNVRAQTPDLILLDIDMPGMDGLTACREIRALPHGGLVPIMMVTGLNDATSVDAAFHCGATDFLVKPLNWVLMRQRVRFMLRHAEVTLRLSRNEEVLEQVQSMVQVGYWEWDLLTGRAASSSSLRQIFPEAPATQTNLQLDSSSHSPLAGPVLGGIREAIARGERKFTHEHSFPRGPRGLLRVLTHVRIDYEGDRPVYILGSTQDVTERYLNEERFAAIFHGSPVGIIEMDGHPLHQFLTKLHTATAASADSDEQLAITSAQITSPQLHVKSQMNEAALKMLGMSTPTSYAPHFYGFALDCGRAVIAAVRNGQADAVLQRTQELPDGSKRSLIVRIPVPEHSQPHQRIVVTITDVTELVDREARLRSADKMIESSNDGIVLLSKERKIVSINPAFAAMTGYSLAQIAGESAGAILAGPDRVAVRREPILEQLRAQGFYRGETEFMRKDGSDLAILLSISTLRDDGGDLSGYVLVITDISRIKESERRLFHLAHFDTLTKLPNRLSLQERLEAEFGQPGGPQQPMTLLYIDLDGFKLVNDSMGHTTGDTLLSEVAQRLQSVCDARNTLARIGGDEFALLMPYAPDRETITTQSKTMLAALARPFHIHDRSIFIGASIGACSYPEHAGNASDMLRNADSAMYEAKRLGRGQLCFYSHALTLDSSRRLEIENELRTAIAEQELFLVYQPKYAAGDGELVGAEALVRWRSPTRGIVPPLEFIGIAEESGLIIALGEWVIHEACRQIAEWRDREGVVMPVAINISALHLRQRSLLRVLNEAITRFNIDPRLLEIEITEDSLDFRDDDEIPYEVLTQLNAMGLSIAIDDFGTGYSSLSQLKKMPISTLKIDRSFVRDIAIDESDHAIITAIVRMAGTLNLSVVAEGVENEQQAEHLRALNCNVFQGFLYSRPVGPAEFVKSFLRKATAPPTAD